MSGSASNEYDQVLYEGFPFPQSHPDRLASIAKLLGMTPAPIAHCRVLELGCGEGENLVPMAYTLPQSTFIGIDQCESGLARGREAISRLRLDNIRLDAMDVRHLAPEVGTFDYIIAHGLYTWVPPDVQESILSICKNNLAPNGVAYVSYCCYPGGKIREMMREMMLFHAARAADPSQQIQHALALGNMIAKASDSDDSYRRIMREDVEMLSMRNGSVLFHDELSPHLTHLYFHEFVARAKKQGLQFLGEADYFEMQYRTWPSEIAASLKELASQDVLLKEQYLDFLKCRRFRQTLLCHRDVSLQRDPSPEKITELYLSSNVTSKEPQPEVAPGTVSEFRGRKGGALATDHPLAKMALIVLSRHWPQALSFRELLVEARTRLQVTPLDDGIDEDALILAEIMLRAYEANLIELHTRSLPCVTSVSERPRVSALARWQLQTRASATTLRHVTMEIDDALGRHLVELLDGTRDRNAVLAALEPLFTSGLVTLTDGGEVITKPAKIREVLGKQLEPKLEQLARLALLEA